MKAWSLLAVDFQSADASQAFAEFVHNTGFGLIKNHPIDPALIADVYAEWETFFNDDRRFDYRFDPKTHDGYIPFELSETAKGHDQKDLKEFYHLYAHGRFPAMLSDKTHQLREQLTQIAATLLRWLDESLPESISKRLSLPLSEMIKESPRTMFRILRYPPLTGQEEPGAVRAAPHGDINFLTVLPAASSKGLQAWGKDEKWHDIPCDSQFLAVNVADMLAECTQNYYPSTIHRVVNPEGEDTSKPRLSLPLFLHGRPEVKLSERHTVDSYWKERLAELGLAE